MDPGPAKRLAGMLGSQRTEVCDRVAERLLITFPELKGSLRLEEAYPPQHRLSTVSVERLNELVRAILLFDLPSLADQELAWARGVLPRSGVTYYHQDAMVRWYFEEVLSLDLPPSERLVAREIEYYLLSLLRNLYRGNS